MPGFGDASVTVPQGAKEPRPVVVVLHGNMDRPEWQCGTWRIITGVRAFVLCPRGIERLDRKRDPAVYTYGRVRDTERELLASIDALRRRFGDYLEPGPMTLVGFSRGAYQAPVIASRHPKLFSNLVLVSGGTDSWKPSVERTLARAGLQRLLFVCGEPYCRNAATQRVASARRQGITARLLSLKGNRHWLTADAAKIVSANWAWVTGR